MSPSRSGTGCGHGWFSILTFALLSLMAPAQTNVFQAVSMHDSNLGSPAGGGGDSGTPNLSADGRYVLFASTANNLVETTNGNAIPARFPAPLNVYLRDRTNALTELISLNLTGAGGGDGNSYPARISTNGRFVLFASTADNLVQGDTNGASDVFVRDRESGTTLLVSRADTGGCGNGASFEPAMSPDGRYVAFASAASNLVAGDTNGITDIFVRDLDQGTTVLVSVGAEPAHITPGLASTSDSPGITPDGRYVVFRSTATNLVAGVTNASEIYVRDLATSTTHWVSSNAQPLLQSAYIFGTAVSFNQQMSADGQVVAFETRGSGANTTAFILRDHLLSGATDLVDTNGIPPVPGSESSLQNLSMTPDGRFVVYLARTNTSAICVRRWDAQTGVAELVSGTLTGTVPTGTSCDWPEVDASGRYVAFVSNAAGLTTNAVLGGYHVYVRDMESGTTRMMDLGTNGLPAYTVAFDTVPALSADGTRVAFACGDGPLVPNDDNHDMDVFVRDQTNDAVELVSVHWPGLESLTPNGVSYLFDSCISSNAQRAAFVSAADSLVPEDTNGVRDVFVRDLEAGTNLLVSVDTIGGAANGGSTEAAISGNGRYVAFTSSADDLVAGDTNGAQDVFLRDLQGGTTRLVSVGTNGISPGNKDSCSPEISTDGRYVLFQSQAQNLAPGTFNGTSENLFLRDMVAACTRALTETFPGKLSAAAMTPDGHYVAFIGMIPGSSQSELYVWDSELQARVYTNTAGLFLSVSISPDGGRLACEMVPSLSPVLRVIDWATMTERQVSNGDFPGKAGFRFSHDGRFLAYATMASNTPSDGNSLSDVYLYDYQSGTNTLVSRSTATGQAANGPSDSPDISPNGRYVAYRSEADDLVPIDGNDTSDIILYDRLTEVTALVSANRSGSNSADNRSSSPRFSADGTTLLWTTWASDELAGDYNHLGDVVAFKLPPPVFVDNDHDGMDDQWELDHFGTLARDGTGDFDHDGASDLFEFQTGTDPTDPASLFRGEIVFSAGPNPEAQLTWTAAPGKNYRVQYKDSLSDPVWHDLDAPTSVVGTTGTASDLAPPANRRFYRIELILSQP